MSMNLACEEMSLWQTPTYISYMCLLRKGDKWEDVRDRYLLWVKQHLEGVWEDEQLEYYEQLKEEIREHVAEVLSHKKLTFYII